MDILRCVRLLIVLSRMPESLGWIHMCTVCDSQVRRMGLALGVVRDCFSLVGSDKYPSHIKPLSDEMDGVKVVLVALLNTGQDFLQAIRLV